MNKVKILTDSCSDLGGDILEKFNIEYAKMNTVYNGRETAASLLWENYTPKELFDIMRGGERVYTTQVPPEEFRKIFTESYENGYDIVYIGCSLKQSGSVNTALSVAKELAADYPDNTAYCIDSLNACLGEGLLTVYAATLRDGGDDAETIFNKVTAKRNNVREYVTVQSLDWLRKSGRVKATAAFFGNLMGVRPILISDADGAQTPIKKVRGRKASLDEIVSRLAETITDAENQTVYIIHADCPDEEVKYLRDTVKEKTHCKDVYVNCMGPIIGASCGPETVGVFAFGEEVTFRA